MFCYSYYSGQLRYVKDAYVWITFAVRRRDIRARPMIIHSASEKEGFHFVKHSLLDASFQSSQVDFANVNYTSSSRLFNLA